MVALLKLESTTMGLKGYESCPQECVKDSKPKYFLFGHGRYPANWETPNLSECLGLHCSVY